MNLCPEKGSPFRGQVMFRLPTVTVSLCSYLSHPRPLPSLKCLVDLVVVTTHVGITTHGHLTFRHENGLSYNARGPFRLPVQVMLLSSSMMLYMSSVGMPSVKPTSVI